MTIIGRHGRVWVLAVNDGEALEIRALLEEQGEQVLESGQKWGASWTGLEPEIQAALDACASSGAAIYGIELAGGNPYGAVNIDHHRYGAGDHCAHRLSSLEQVAAIVGALPLSRWRTLVALNGRGYIPAAMVNEGGAAEEEVAAVRRADRVAQGLTAEQEAAAARDLRDNAVYSHDGRRVGVWCPEGSTSAHADGLYGGRAPEILLVGPGEWNYTLHCR